MRVMQETFIYKEEGVHVTHPLWIEIKVLVHRNESHIFYSFLTFVSKNYV